MDATRTGRRRLGLAAFKISAFLVRLFPVPLPVTFLNSLLRFLKIANLIVKTTSYVYNGKTLICDVELKHPARQFKCAF